MCRQKKLLLLLGRFLVMFLLVLPPLFAHADEPSFGGTSASQRGCDPRVQLCNPIKFNSFPELIAGITKIAIDIGVPLAALGIIYSGFLLVKAQDNPGARAEAQKTLGYTLLGATILLGAFVIVKLLEGTVKQIVK